MWLCLLERYFKFQKCNSEDCILLGVGLWRWALLTGKVQLPWKSSYVTFTPLVAGTAAMRNTKRGSWYIEALAQVFSERACDMHVADMLVKVGQFQLAP